MATQTEAPLLQTSKVRSNSMSSTKSAAVGKPRRKSSMSSASGSPPSTINKATHVCPECSRAFSRAEHLERHLTTHMPASTSKTFICPACSKGFTRKDVLTRHIRAVHETPKTEVKRSRRRSCRRCANFKIKCSGGAKKGQPQAVACEACIKRQVDCVFDVEPLAEGDEATAAAQYGQANSEEMDGYSSEDGQFRSEVNEPPLKRRRTIGTIGERQHENLNAYDRFGQDRSMDMSEHLLSAALYMSDEQRMETQYPWLDTRLQSSSMNSMSGNGTSYGENGQRRGLEDLQSHTNALSQKNDQYNTPFHAPSTLESHPDLSATSGLPLDPSLLQLLSPAHLNANLFGTPPAHQENEPQMVNGNSSYSNDLHSVPEEDYYAASTLQGLLPGLSDGLNSNANLSGSNGYSMLNHGQNDASNMFANGGENSLISGVMQQQNQTQDPPIDHRLLGDKVNQQMEDQAENWFFDPGVFEFDWLRGDLVDLTLPMKDYPNESQATSAAPTLTNASKTINANNTPTMSSLSYYSQPDFSHITNKKLESHIRSTAASETRSNSVDGPSEKTADEDALRLPPVSPPKDAARNEDVWPWDWQLSSEKQQKINLPPLRQVLEEYTTPQSNSSRTFSDQMASSLTDLSSPPSSTTSSSSNPNVTDKIRQDMISLLTVPFKKQPYVPLDISLDKFPNNELFNDFIRLYFENFHGVLPMVHVPTFRPEKCPSILLAAIATIGARYHPAERAKDFADSLSELSHRSMAWMGEYNNNYLRSGFFLMAFCLQNVYALGAGNRHLFELADASRSFLINNARRAGLFSPSSGVGSPNFINTQTGAIEDPYLCKADLLNEERLEARWLAWRDEEADKRLAWCIFEYDCAISTLSNRRGNIAFNDMCMRIPCEEVLWEAPNAGAWAALYPRYRSNPPKGLPFYPVLRDVISGKMKPTLLPNWGKRLCSQVIARIIWDFKELEDSALNRCLVLPMLTPGLKPAKDTLLRTLMVLVNSMTEREGMSEMIHMSMTHISSHHSFLYAARDIMDLAISLARKTAPPTPTANVEERLERTSRMKNIFTADPVNARALAWHAVQILAIGRAYHVHTSADTLRVFMGGVYLWAFAKYFPHAVYFSQNNGDEKKMRGKEAIKLDYLPWMKAGAAEADDWIKHGGKAKIEGVEHLNSPSAPGEVLKLVMELLQRMKLWGIGEKFCMAVQEMALVD